MRSSIKKHYRLLHQFIRAANLGWEEILKRNDFPSLDELDPNGKHRALLARIERAVATRFSKINPAGSVPLLAFPNWRATGRADWRRLHCYALVRRLFDSLDFLTRTNSLPRPAAAMVPLTLQFAIAADGSAVRVRDPFEDFLNELSGCDLHRLRACPACRRFFIAWRLDQKACRRQCANLIRVHRFRQKKDEYAKNRQFRRLTGLPAVRRGRNRLLRLHAALRSTDGVPETSLVMGPPQDAQPDPSGHSD